MLFGALKKLPDCLQPGKRRSKDQKNIPIAEPGCFFNLSASLIRDNHSSNLPLSPAASRSRQLPYRPLHPDL